MDGRFRKRMKERERFKRGITFLGTFRAFHIDRHMLDTE